MQNRAIDSLIEIEQLSNIIKVAAREELLPRFNRVKRGIKADGSVITEADVVVQTRIAEELKTYRPGTGFLGEEMEAAKQQELLDSGKPVWCLDPLDGTSNFAAGIPFFSVSLSLLENGQVSAGVVYDPMRDECFAAVKGQGATLNGESLEAVDTDLSLKQTTAIIDFKRLPQALSTRLVTEIPYASQRSFGSVALDWCWIAAGRSHIYLHGKQNIWDYSAGNLILLEAGGHATTLTGVDVFQNSLQPRSAVAALDKNLFDEWCKWLAIRINEARLD